MDPRDKDGGETYQNTLSDLFGERDEEDQKDEEEQKDEKDEEQEKA